jgi:hypothetical protein
MVLVEVELSSRPLLETHDTIKSIPKGLRVRSGGSWSTQAKGEAFQLLGVATAHEYPPYEADVIEFFTSGLVTKWGLRMYVAGENRFLMRSMLCTFAVGWEHRTTEVIRSSVP